jgi:phosphoadenosine phosphosulfate reductase
MPNVLPFKAQCDVTAHLCDGCSVNATERLTSVTKKTILRLLLALGDGCAWLHNRLVRGVVYVGISWGKDSVVVAHLVHRLKLDVPAIFFPAGPVENPDCALVRDAFLARFDLDYREHEVSDLVWTVDGSEIVHDGAQAAFARTARAQGSRYASGVRGEESRARALRMRHWGESSPHTCAPIGFWTLADVYGYLAKHDLPIHPAYACTWGGRYPREAIRVSTIGGVMYGHHGRRQWEASYYPETLRTVREMGERWRRGGAARSG